ncbi:MAG TPA: AsmA family protein [Steroidobacteraceae bacterium]|nr:AsmA family protein [Steroidobacteraceae bacterium]
MRALKIAGIVVAALVALVLLALGALLLFVNPNDYRDDIAKLVEQKTGRPLTIGGDLGLKVFPWIALDIHDVTLGNPSGYGNEPFLTVQRASVGVKLLPLLSKRVEVSRVAIDGLAVTLVSRSETENNWKDLGSQTPAEAPSSSGPPPQASIGGVDISNSSLVYRDEAKKSVTRLTGLEVHTGALGSGEPVKVELKVDYDEGAPPTLARVDMRATVRLLAQNTLIEVKDLDASAKWLGAPSRESGAAAKPAAAKKSEPLDVVVRSDAFTVDTKAETLALSMFDVKVGELPIKLTAKGARLFGDYVIDGNLAIEKTSARKLMQSFGIEPPVTSDPKALSVFALKSDYSLTPKEAGLKALDLTLDDTHIRGLAGIEDLEAMSLRFDLGVDAINVDRYLAPTPEKKDGTPAAPASAAAAKPPTELPLDALRALNARGLLRIGKATVTQLPFTDVRLPLDAKGGRVHLGPTQAKLFGGGYNGDILLDARPAKATLSLNEHVKGVDVGELLKASLDTTRVAGKGNANAQLTASGNTDAALFKSLAGKIDFDIKNGAITGIDLWYEIRRALALFKQQAAPAREAGPPKTAFNALSGSAVVDNGVLRNDDLIADMTYLKVKGKGTLALESQAIDYRLTTEVYKLPPSEEAQLADLKAAEIPVTITGTLADMKVRPDVEGYLKSRFKKKADEKIEQKKEELKKKLSDKLKGLFGK